MLFALLAAATLAAVDQAPFPSPPSIKGLQVQMADDAIALGIHHACININLTAVLDPQDPLRRFDEKYLASLDDQIKPLSDAGVVVYVILLTYPSKDPARNRIAIHPKARSDQKYTIGAFNTATKEGRAWLEAVIGMLARRWSGKSARDHGRVWGWIVGNEINSHWTWNNLGSVPLNEVASEYEKAHRIAHKAVRRASRHGRTYISLDHNWRIRAQGVGDNDAVPGRDFLDTFARLARARGDFDWNVAHHPYSEDLRNPRVWADASIDDTDDTVKVTFKNLPVLCRHLERPELLFRGRPRRIILSEQGFHTLPQPDGEALQAAAYAYAWEKTIRQPQVDAFVYHRHVDHAHEGGLLLGLWRNKPGSVADPASTKMIYELFKAAGTPAWDDAARFALPVCGLRSWDELR